MAIACAACVIGAAGYAVYFDRCRVNDPEYLKKLKITRRALRLAKEDAAKAAAKDGQAKGDAPPGSVPLEKYFVQEIELGDAYLRKGDEAEAVIHFANAISIHANQREMLDMMQPHMPASTFQLLLQTLAKAAGQPQN